MITIEAFSLLQQFGDARMGDGGLGSKIGKVEAKRLAIEHMSKALQINGKKEIAMLEAYARMAGDDTYLGRLLAKSLVLARKEHLLAEFFEESRTASKIEKRRLVAQVKSSDRYESVVHGIDPLFYPADFRKPSIEPPREWDPLATSLVSQAAEFLIC